MVNGEWLDVKRQTSKEG